MAGRNSENDKIDGEYWSEEFDNLDLNEEEPAVYIGEDRYDSIEDAAEDPRIDASAKTLGRILEGEVVYDDVDMGNFFEWDLSEHEDIETGYTQKESENPEIGYAIKH